MSLRADDTMSVRHMPLEKFHALTSPLSAPVSSRRCVVSNAMLVIALGPCARSNLHAHFDIRHTAHACMTNLQRTRNGWTHPKLLRKRTHAPALKSDDGCST